MRRAKLLTRERIGPNTANHGLLISGGRKFPLEWRLVVGFRLVSVGVAGT